MDRLAVGRNPVSPELKIYVTIWYLANQETFRQLSDRFGIALSTAYEVIREMTSFLVRESSKYIKWPKPEEYPGISNEFEKFAGIKGIIGAIDGCHIRIRKPQQCPMDYYNRKKYYSVLIQGVVDHTKKFIDVSCGEPGSMHDWRVLQRTKLYENAEERNIFRDFFLLGDSAYKNNEWIVTPFKDFGNLSDQQKNFNYLHSKSRITVENAFGLLKGKFRKLFSFDNFNIEFIINCIMAACTLHNIYLIYERDAVIDNTSINDEDPVDSQNVEDDLAFNNNKRTIVFQQMINHNKI